MNTAFKIMVYTLMLNFSVAIMLQALPIFSDEGATGGVGFDNQFAGTFTEGMQETVEPSSILEDKGNAIYRVLDLINLGFIQRFLETVSKYLYGFVDFLNILFGGALNSTPEGEELYTILFGRGLGEGFGLLYQIINVALLYSAWWLWTGKRLND